MSPSGDDTGREAADDITARPAGDVESARPTRQWSTTRTDRPPRPEMSDLTPAPVAGRDAIPPPILRSQSLWYVSMTMVFFAVVTLFLTRSGLITNLVDLLRQQDPQVSDGRLADLSPLIIYGVLAVLLVVGLLEWGFASVLLRRRRWPRLVMVPLSVVHLAVVAGCSLVIPLSSWQGWLLVTVLGISALVSLVAAVRAFAPSVTRWIRTRRDDERDERDENGENGENDELDDVDGDAVADDDAGRRDPGRVERS